MNKVVMVFQVDQKIKNLTLYLEKWTSWALQLLLQLYKIYFSAWLTGVCRHSPSCSVFASQALVDLPPWMAIKLILGRILRCHPFGSWGFDPVSPLHRKDGHE